jgi:hypothetical protein
MKLFILLANLAGFFTATCAIPPRPTVDLGYVVQKGKTNVCVLQSSPSYDNVG